MAVKGITVTLSRAEILNAAITGVFRRVNGLLGATQTVPGLDDGGMGWVRDIEAACAERAVARVLDRYWDASLGRYRDSELGDVGPIQVRHTIHERGHLVVRDHDKLSAPFVLVVGVAPHYRVVGWMLGAEARNGHYQDDPGDRGQPCGWVPQEALHEMTELPR